MSTAPGEARRSELKILVVIPIVPYNDFLEVCPVSSGQYEMLKNGLEFVDLKYGKAVEILCEMGQAKVLLGLSTVIFPAAAPYIQESILLARQP